MERLGAGHAIVVGVGALGCASAQWLARAGVGRLTLIDRDVVEESNLQRQVLFDEEDARQGLPKAEAAAARLRLANGALDARARVADLTARNARALLGDDPRAVIVDGTDNFETRYLLNDGAVALGMAFCYAGVVGTTATTMTVIPASAGHAIATPCLRCVAPALPAPGSVGTCETLGVLGPAVGLAAALQATDALKVLLGREGEVARALTEWDAWSGTRRAIALGAPDPACPCCAGRRFEFLEGRGGGDAVVLCGEDAVQVSPGEGATVDLDALAGRLQACASVERRASMVRARLTDASPAPTLTVFADGRAIVRGTTDPARARALYARYVGS